MKRKGSHDESSLGLTRCQESVQRTRRAGYAGGTQIVTSRGKETVVVLSIEAFRHLTTAQESLVAFFRQSPLVGAQLDLTRDADTGRAVVL